MIRILLCTLALAVATLPNVAGADQLTAIIQQDLVALGYAPGNTDGEATVETAIAISKFQAEHDLDVTGEASPQLAGVIKAALSQQGPAAAPAAAAAAPAAAAQAPAADPAMAAAAAQQACLQRKMAAAQEAQESARKRRGFGSLMRAVSRIGGSDVSSAVNEISSDIYNVSATVSDLESAARDLGLTETDIEDCRNPQ